MIGISTEENERSLVALFSLDQDMHFFSRGGSRVRVVDRMMKSSFSKKVDTFYQT